MVTDEILAALRAESARLISLLESHGIDWRLPETEASDSSAAVSPSLSPEQKVALFRRLFRGRADVFPIRRESKTTGKTDYAPACAHDRFTRNAGRYIDAARRTGTWIAVQSPRKPCARSRKFKCGECSHRLLIRSRMR